MKTTSDVMIRDPVCCTPDDSVVEAARIMERDEVSVVPIVESADTRKLVGVVTDRDLCLMVVAAGLPPFDVTVEECMTDEVITVGEETDLREVLRLMQQERQWRIPVVDATGACVGMVAQGDVIVALQGNGLGAAASQDVS